MKIHQMISQSSRDFYATFKCEGCSEVSEEMSGYDDRNFHDKVIPDMKCKKCGKSSKDLGTEISHTETKYPSWMVV